MGLYFSVQESLLVGSTVAQKWDVARRMGYDGLELLGTSVSDMAARLPELRSAKAAGAFFSSICVISDRFIGDWDAGRRDEALTMMKMLLSVAGELGANGAITPASYGMHSNFLPPFVPSREGAEDRTVLLDMLGALGDHAKSEGVLLLLEPLNRYEDHMLNRLSEGVELLEKLGHSSVKLMADFYHMNIEEDDLAVSLEAAIGQVAHIHLADSNRLEPGKGHTDFASLFAVLTQHGFTGACAIECLLSGAPEETIAAALPFLKTAEKGA